MVNFRYQLSAFGFGMSDDNSLAAFSCKDIFKCSTEHIGKKCHDYCDKGNNKCYAEPIFGSFVLFWGHTGLFPSLSIFGRLFYYTIFLKKKQ